MNVQALPPFFCSQGDGAHHFDQFVYGGLVVVVLVLSEGILQVVLIRLVHRLALDYRSERGLEVVRDSETHRKGNEGDEVEPDAHQLDSHHSVHDPEESIAATPVLPGAHPDVFWDGIFNFLLQRGDRLDLLRLCLERVNLKEASVR